MRLDNTLFNKKTPSFQSFINTPIMYRIHPITSKVMTNLPFLINSFTHSFVSVSPTFSFLHLRHN